MRYSVWVVTLLGLLPVCYGFSQESNGEVVECTYQTSTDTDLDSTVTELLRRWQQNLLFEKLSPFRITRCEILKLTPENGTATLTAKLGYKTDGHGLLGVRWNGRLKVKLPLLKQDTKWNPLNQLATVTAEHKAPILGSWKPDNSEIGPLVHGLIKDGRNAAAGSGGARNNGRR